VLDIGLLATGDIAFGSNSWRGDDYEAHLRQAIASHDARRS
jgi:23S rRNA G2445 N2-methylase RlmL